MDRAKRVEHFTRVPQLEPAGDQQRAEAGIYQNDPAIRPAVQLLDQIVERGILRIEPAGDPARPAALYIVETAHA